MANLLTINSSPGACDDTLDIDALFREQLAPLLQKFKYRLSQFEQSVNNDSKRLQKYSRAKIKRAYTLLETLDKEWHRRWQMCSVVDNNNRKQQQQTMVFSFLMQTLEQSLADLSEKYHELEATLVKSDDYFEARLDDTIDAMMTKIEEVDGKISDAIDRAIEMRNKVHEKIHEVAGRASEQMDILKHAMAKGAKQLLHYEELPAAWRNNKVTRSPSLPGLFSINTYVTVHPYRLSILIDSGTMLALAPLPAQWNRQHLYASCRFSRLLIHRHLWTLLFLTLVWSASHRPRHLRHLLLRSLQVLNVFHCVAYAFRHQRLSSL